MGILALTDIREAIGPKRGLGYAVTAAVTCPVIVADVVFGYLFAGFFMTLFSRHEDQFMSSMLFFWLPVMLLLDGAVIQRVIRWGKGLPLINLSRRTGLWLVVGTGLWAVLFVVSLSSLLVTHDRARRSREEYDKALEVPPAAMPSPDFSGSPVSPIISQASVPTNPVTVPSLSSSAPQATRFVIDSVRDGANTWHFHALIPPNSTVQFLFVQWTNGVPAVHPRSSRYFKVGDKALDVNFSMSWTRRGQDSDLLTPVCQRAGIRETWRELETLRSYCQQNSDTALWR